MILKYRILCNYDIIIEDLFKIGEEKMDKTKFYTNRKNIVFLAAICCALWGSAFPAVKVGYSLFNIAGDDIATKLIFAGIRFAMAGIFVLISQVALGKKLFSFSKTDTKEFVVLGIIQTTLQYIFFYIGMAYTTGVRGSIINGTGTFFSIILAHFIYKNDKIDFNKIVGCIIGFLGVIIVNLDGSNLMETSFKFKGEGFIMLSALMLSISSIYSKKVTRNKDASIVTGYQLFIGGSILIVLGLVFGGHLSGFTIKSSLLLIYMALISSVAFAIWTQLLKYNKVSTICVFNFLIPIFGSALSAIVLGDDIFNVKILIALILVSIGIFLVYKEKRKC